MDREAAIKHIQLLEGEIEEHAYQMGECSCEQHHNDMSCNEKRTSIERIKDSFNINEDN